MKDNSTALPISSEIDVKKLKVGDHVFSADFGTDSDNKIGFIFSEFEIKKIKKNHIEGLENNLWFECFNVETPKVTFNTDLASGMFLSKEEAARAFVDTIKTISEMANVEYNKLFG